MRSAIPLLLNLSCGWPRGEQTLTVVDVRLNAESWHPYGHSTEAPITCIVLRGKDAQTYIARSIDLSVVSATTPPP